MMTPDAESTTQSPGSEKPSQGATALVHEDIELAAQTNRYILDAKQLDSNAGNLNTAADGRTILIPQPTEDPHDPLNWSSRKKHTILLVIAFLAALPDFGSSLGAVTLIPQAILWKLPQNTVQHNLVGNLICLGMGGLFTVALSEYFGRLPVLLAWQLLAFGTGIWCAAAQSFDSFLAARIVNGFFAIAAQAGGLMWIKDMFFFHEHPRKINLWSGPIILSPYLGPFVAAFVIWRLSWRWSYWIYTILNAVGLLVLLLLDETYYDRSLLPDQQPAWNSRLLRFLGVERHPRGSFFRSIVRPAVAFSKAPVFLVTVYYLLNFAWIIGVNATISTWLTEYYDFTPKSLGFFYFAPMIGSIMGDVVGHWAHDYVGSSYARRHGGRINPEARLILCYPAGILMAVGLLVLGFALQYRWHWGYLAVFAAMQVAGIMIATTAVNAYLLDSYPEGSGEVGAWINVGRTFGGFMATYIEIPWVFEAGARTAFSIQTGITVAAMFIPLFLQLFGRRIRQLQGPMEFPNVRKMNSK